MRGVNIWKRQRKYFMEARARMFVPIVKERGVI